MDWAPDPADGASAACGGVASTRAVDGPAAGATATAGPHAQPAPGYEAMWAAMPPLQVFGQLQSSPGGLAEDDAQARLVRYGDNTVTGPRTPRRSRLLRVVADPFVLVLLCLDAVSAGIDSTYNVVVISVLAALSCVLRLHQEHRSAATAAALQALVPATATVVRRATRGAAPLTREVLVDQLVPGDIVKLAPGDMVPADLRLLRSAGLAVSQAVLTGESAPVGKCAGGRPATGVSPPECPQLCLAESSVTSGSGTGIVVATGPDTYFGATGRRLPRRAPQTCFDRCVKDVSWTLIRFMLTASALIVAITWATGRQTALLYVISVAVGLTPEMLPVVVTSALARAAQVMARAGVIVKRLPAVHDLGAMDVLCTDKTGTLTEGLPTLDSCLDPWGRPDDGVLRWACLNSYWSLHDAEGPVCDSLDEALLEHAAGAGLPVDDGFTGVDLIPLGPHSRRVTVILRQAGRLGSHTLITKGAPEEVLECCARVLTGDGATPLRPDCRTRLAELADAHAAGGARLLAVAIAERPARLGRYGAADATGMTLAGFVSFRDKPKTTAARALSALAAGGISIKIVTGDHPLLAVRACRQAGIRPGTAVLGEDLDRLTDSELAGIAETAVVFARVTPERKARIVRALRTSGHTVGYLGDGVNDAAAMLVADVGVAAESSVGIARESADVILVRPDLTAVADAVAHARRAVGNIVKYVKIIVSSNAGNVASILAASAVLPFLPMLPLQVMVQNLCFDASQLTIAFDRVDGPSLTRPATLGRRGLIRFVACFGLINTLADLAAFTILWRIGGAHHDPAVFRAGWFTENLVTQSLAVLLLRSRNGPSRRHRPAWPVLLAAAAVAATGLFLPLSPAASALAMHAPPGVYFLLLAGVLAGYGAVTLAARAVYPPPGDARDREGSRWCPLWSRIWLTASGTSSSIGQKSSTRSP